MKKEKSIKHDDGIKTGDKIKQWFRSLFVSENGNEAKENSNAHLYCVQNGKTKKRINKNCQNF